MIWVSPFDTEFKIHVSRISSFSNGGLLGSNGKKSSFHLFPNSMKAKKKNICQVALNYAVFNLQTAKSAAVGLSQPGEGFLWVPEAKAAWPWPHC